MKTIGRLFFVLICFGGSLSFALPVDHKITAVTVYRDRALVTRSAQVSLTPGMQNVVFERLPVALDENSVRARGSGSASFKILGIELRRQYQDKATNLEVNKLELEMRKVDDQQRVYTDERADLEQRRNFLNDLRNRMVNEQPKTMATNQVSPVSLKSLFDFYTAEYSKITDRLRALDLLGRDLNEQRDKLTRQINLLQRPADPDTRTVVVMVDSKEAGTGQVEISYVMHGASWQPQYDAHASVGDQKVELAYYGVVSQTTGESWDDVALSLSTARPNSGARIPDLGAWQIDLFDPAVPRSLSRNEMDENGAGKLNATMRAKRGYDMPQASAAPMDVMNASVQAQSMAKALDEKAADYGVAQVSDTGPAALFTVPGKVNIPSDGQPHRNTISIQNLTGDWQYEVTPKLAQSAFLKVKVNNTSAGPLLPGEVNAFLENDYVGKAWIGLVPPRSSFDLFLGTDDGIKVTRTAGVDKEEESGVLSKTKVLKRSYTIEIENYKKADETFRIHDQIPISKKDDLKVVVNKMSIVPKKKDENTGELTWELKLAPQEKQKIEVEFQVECDPKKQVVGL